MTNRKTSYPTNPSPGKHERGQGWLEYAIIAVLVILAIASLWAFFGPDIQKWMEESRLAGELPPTPTVLPPEISKAGVFAEIIETETITATNCTPAVATPVPVERVRQLEHRIELNDRSLDPELAATLVSRLEEAYGFGDGEIEEKTFTFDLPVQPGQQMSRLVEWQYLWDEGTITMYNPDGSSTRHGYRARVAVEYNEIGTNEEPTDCEP